jgi:hypothetical protein
MRCHEHEQHIQDARCSVCHLDLKRYPLRPVVDYSHQGDYMKRHAFAARASGASCANCHEQQFCLDCHARTTKLPAAAVYADRPDRDFIHRGDFLSRHPIEARSESTTCAACHAQSTCVSCHQAQHVAPVGLGSRNPHPRHWSTRGGSEFHGDAARRDISSCAACHDQGARSNCVDCHKVGGVGGDPHPPGYSTVHSIADAAKNPMCRNCH